MNKQYTIILCIVLFTQYLEGEKVLTDAVFGRTPSKIIKQIYTMFGITDNILKKHNISYWMIGGTMLGASRHKGMIRWDDDGDLAIAPEVTRKQIFALKKDFDHYHLQLHETLPHLIKVLPRNKKYPFIDLFMTTHDHEKKIIYLTNTAFPDMWYEYELYPLKNMVFGPLRLPATMQYMRYLFAKYGNDCMTHATYRVHLPHRKKNQYRHQKVKIVNFKPAAWH